MIITRTPFRISICGGGTDFPAWYNQHGGAVLGFALAKYCWIQVRHLPPFFDHTHRVVHSQIELVRELREIEHPAARAVLVEKWIAEGGLEIMHTGDLPARAGLGSSSSFTVGLLNALAALQGKRIDKQSLAQEAIHIEQEIIREAVGSQDQVWAAYGGMARIDFDVAGFHYRPLIISSNRIAELLSRLSLHFTGISRFAVEVEAAKIARIAEATAQLHIIRASVDEAEDILTNPKRNLDDLGRLLDFAWAAKKELAASVSNPHLDAIYDRARKAGALGGKLLGAGGGGFFLFYTPEDKHNQVRKALADLIEVPISIDKDGSRVVVFEPNGL
jgi:D-glycero-alpha-D-manno-heptose-7-phosphate kinase